MHKNDLTGEIYKLFLLTDITKLLFSNDCHHNIKCSYLNILHCEW